MYVLLKKLCSFSSWMGPRGWRFWGTCFGTILWWFLPSKRRTIMIDSIMSSLEIDKKQALQLGKTNCINMGILLFEAMALPKLNPENIRDWVTIKGEEHFQEAFAQGRGVVIATAHLGNWEWLGAALALYGYPTVAVMTPQHNKQVNQVIVELRAGANMILNMRADVRDMVRHLRQGHSVGLLMDQFAPQSTVRANFFGRYTQCQPGAAVLGRMQKAPIVPIFIHRLPDGRHEVEILPMMFVDPNQDKKEAETETVQELIAIIEQKIRSYPEEWFWLHNRWKMAGRSRTTTD